MRAEDVELDLALGGVADPHRPAAGVARQFGDVGLGREMATGDEVQRVQALGVVALLQDPQHPVQVGHGLAEAAEADQRARGHRGVPQPAVAVVPVADAADRLGQRGRGRGQDRAGGAVAEGLEGQGTAADQLGLDRGERELVGPALPEREGVGPALVLGPRVGLGAGGAVAELEDDRLAGQLELNPGRVVAAVVGQLPLHPGGAQHHQVGGVDHLHAALADGQAGAVAAEVERGANSTSTRPRPSMTRKRSLRPGQAVGPTAGGVEVVGDGEPVPPGLQDHGVLDVALPGRLAAVGRGRRRSSPPPDRRPARRRPPRSRCGGRSTR